MKSKIAVLFLIGLLCLTMGCSNTSHIAEQAAPVSSSESNKAPDQSETAQAEKKTEVDRPVRRLSRRATERNIARSALKELTKLSRQSTQEENGQSRKIGAEKASNIKAFQFPHFEG